MHVLVAPNAFKHSVSAAVAAEAIAAGLRESSLDCTVECFPIGDGGDGTGELLIAHQRGTTITAEAHDAIGRPIRAQFGLIDEGRTAVIELAEASGLRRLADSELNPLSATTFGTGELIRNALDRGARRILLAVGGSATVDGGAGILQALGARFFAASGARLDGSPKALSELSAVDLSGIDRRCAEAEVVVLCDVENSLLGPSGAARVFGPQKGATPPMVDDLERVLTRWAEVLRKTTGTEVSKLPRGGAAGGVAAGLHAALNAKLVSGIDTFLEITGFDAALARADLVITGEGSIDEQTLAGKGPHAVAVRARARGVSVVGLAGKIPEQPSLDLRACFDRLIAISDPRMDLSVALRETAVNLSRVARRLGDEWPRG